jgi:hypothetical protein
MCPVLLYRYFTEDAQILYFNLSQIYTRNGRENLKAAYQVSYVQFLKRRRGVGAMKMEAIWGIYIGEEKFIFLLLFPLVSRVDEH